jgi:hypothetical protein
MKKTLGWLIVILAVVWGIKVAKDTPPSGPDGLGYSRLIGGLLLPILLGLVGLTFAGVVKRSK